MILLDQKEMSLKNKEKKPGRGVRLKAPVIKNILKLRAAELSMNQIQQLTGASKGSVNTIIQRAVKATVSAEKAQALPDEELLSMIYPNLNKENEGADTPNFENLKSEMVKPGVNAQLLWEEYHELHRNGMKRSTFYEHLKAAGPPEEPKVNMHQVAKGGEKLLIDYSGEKASYFDKSTGKEVKVELFVANWMASSYLYVEASPSQKQEDWIASHARAFKFFGHTPTYLVPDNLKSGIIKADFYDPTVNSLYDQMSKHYGCAILPARSRRPQDKASVESNVKFVQIHILGRLRNRKFGSLKELNEAIMELLILVNDRKMQRFHLSRKERFEELDVPHAGSLPSSDFYVQEIKDDVLVQEDHHVPFDGHYYSVPWRLTSTRINIWKMGSEIQIYQGNERVTSHKINSEKGGYTTNNAHRPPNHLFMRNLNPLWVLNQAQKIGPRTHEIIRNMIAADPGHSEVPIRKGLGIVSLAKSFPNDRVESAVCWSLDHAMFRVEDIRRVLEHNLDQIGPSPRPPFIKKPRDTHENIRGSHYYSNIQKG
jgi:transposase